MEAYFALTTADNAPEFIFKLTDEDRIAEARRILSGEEKNKIHVHGRLSRSKAPYNPRWNFYLKPETINFFEVAIEVCDATTEYVEDHLDEAGGAFLPGLHWCPWSSRLTREIKE